MRKTSQIDFPSQITTVRGGPLWTTCSLLKWNKGAEREKVIVDLRRGNCTWAHVQQNKSIYLSIYFSAWKRSENGCIYIYITSGEFHTDRSRIVLNDDGAVITMFIYSISFHIDFNTGLFRRPTKSWSNCYKHALVYYWALWKQFCNKLVYLSSFIVEHSTQRLLSWNQQDLTTQPRTYLYHLKAITTVSWLIKLNISADVWDGKHTSTSTLKLMASRKKRLDSTLETHPHKYRRC